MADYIKIPKDFKSLHELKDLVNNYDLVTRLSNALNGYQRMYLDSYLMTYDEVLKFIPEFQHSIYNVQIRDNNSDYIMNEYVFNKKLDKHGYARIPLSKVLLKMDVKKDDKSFLVNAEDKIVNVCFWANSISLDSKTLNKTIKKLEDDTFSEGTKHKSDVVFTGKIDFSLDSETRTLVIHAHYSVGAIQSVGGVWINGRERGYLTGHSESPYTIEGYDIYHFCTKTNKYIGYKGFKQDPYRGWMEIKRRY